ncbi:unnamed protein product [Parnassius apollo]|uniref:(apollo) hypothetical protein n=1 Tax=Parnassius apollo TaxID=110799 RepID=A0A8S3WX82_PARAO|nr:unnamed protein product [Parnassius apollo]
MKQYTAKSVASLRPRSGSMRGSGTSGASSRGEAALMAGAARGRGRGACGAIVAAGAAGSAHPSCVRPRARRAPPACRGPRPAPYHAAAIDRSDAPARRSHVHHKERQVHHEEEPRTK